MDEIKFRLSLDDKEFVRGMGGADASAAQLVKRFAGVAAVISSIKVAWDQMNRAVDEAATFEKYQTSLTVMLGSAEKAKLRLKELSDFAASTPFELSQVVEAGNQLQALGAYSIETLRDLGDLAAASGKPIEQVLSAFAKLRTGQKGIAIDMFRDLLITTDDWVKATGKKLSSNGELQATWQQMAEALPRIIREKGFAGMMAEQSKTLDGMRSNLSDSISRMYTAWGEKLLPTFKSATSALTEVVSVMTPVKTNAEATQEKFDQQRLSLEMLIAEYEHLRNNTSRTEAEQSRFLTVINELKKAYPEHLSQLDLQKGKLEDIREGFDSTRGALEDLAMAQILYAKVQDEMNVIADAQIRIAKEQKSIYESQAKLKTFKGPFDRAAEQISLRDQIKESQLEIGYQKELIRGTQLYIQELKNATRAGILFDEQVVKSDKAASAMSTNNGELKKAADERKKILKDAAEDAKFIAEENEKVQKYYDDKEQQAYDDGLKRKATAESVARDNRINRRLGIDQDVPYSLQRLRNKEKTSVLTEDEIVQKSQQEQQLESMREFKSKSIGYMRQIGSSLSDSLAQAAVDGEFSMSSFFKNTAKMLLSSGLNMLFQGGISALFGGSFSSGAIMGFARGGEINEPQFILAGEEEPEIIAPKSDFKEVIGNLINSMSGRSSLSASSVIRSTATVQQANPAIVQELRLLRFDLKEKELATYLSADARRSKLFELNSKENFKRKKYKMY